MPSLKRHNDIRDDLQRALFKINVVTTDESKLEFKRPGITLVIRKVMSVEENWHLNDLRNNENYFLNLSRWFCCYLLKL